MKRAFASAGSVAGLDPNMTEEIQRAIEIMRRVRVANVERVEKALEAYEGLTYVVPEPVKLHIGSSA